MSFKDYLERYLFIARVAGFLLFAALITIVVPSGVAGEWKYITGPASTAAVSSILQTVRLSGDRPNDLTEDVEYQGERRLYAQLRYGSPNSVRVAIVVDHRDSGQVDLFLDANRNRTIQSKERLQGSGSRWHVPLDVAIVGEGTVIETFHRVVVIERGVLPRTLTVGTLGYK